jgi:stage IV sporulation protein B
MRKKIKLFLVFALVLISVLNVKILPVRADESKIYLGGMPAGFSLYTKGVKVVGLCDVITENGIESPAKNSEIKIGDTILSIGKHQINSAKDIENALNDFTNNTLTLIRNGVIISEKITPAKDLGGNYRLGVFVKENVDGIGTITFIKGNRFASLGHPVTDEYGNVLNISGGDLFECNITGCVKGERGKAGELRGVFSSKNKIATIDKNTSYGVFGNFSNDFIKKQSLVEIEIGKARIGEAFIYSTICGEAPKQYKISIIKTDYNNKVKNFVVKIDDNKLLEDTGGIVQGMSGSPIVQNGKLVGAITHVFVNDPTRGFGIAIENMLDC